MVFDKIYEMAMNYIFLTSR